MVRDELPVQVIGELVYVFLTINHGFPRDNHVAEIKNLGEAAEHVRRDAGRFVENLAAEAIVRQIAARELLRRDLRNGFEAAAFPLRKRLFRRGNKGGIGDLLLKITALRRVRMRQNAEAVVGDEQADFAVQPVCPFVQLVVEEECAAEALPAQLNKEGIADLIPVPPVCLFGKELEADVVLYGDGNAEPIAEHTDEVHFLIVFDKGRKHEGAAVFIYLARRGDADRFEIAARKFGRKDRPQIFRKFTEIFTRNDVSERKNMRMQQIARQPVNFEHVFPRKVDDRDDTALRRQLYENGPPAEGYDLRILLDDDALIRQILHESRDARIA